MTKGKIFDRTGRILATIVVKREGDIYRGCVVDGSLNKEVEGLFVEFEAAVNEQLFVEVGRLESRIGSLRPVFIADSGRQLQVRDLQIYPNLESLSFRPEQ